jgi:prepilin peptidase CpaA
MFIILLATSAVTDLLYKRIPNWLISVALASGLLTNIITRGTEGFFFSAAGIAVGFGVLIVFYVIQVMGAGDVKLMAAVGSFVGPQEVFLIFILATLLGGIYALGLLLLKGYLWQALKRYGRIGTVYLSTKQFVYISPPEQEKKLKLCYGVVVALGVLIFKISGDRIPFL